MLGEFTLTEGHLTTATNGPATTDGIDINAEFARRLQQRRLQGETATPSRRCEDDEGVAGCGVARHAGGVLHGDGWCRRRRLRARPGGSV